MIEIAVSYSRKISHDHYGGNKYESTDHFCSLKEEVPQDTPPEALKSVYRDLKAQCKEMVLQDVMSEIAAFTGSLSEDELRRLLRFYRGLENMTPDEYEELVVKLTPLEQTLCHEFKKLEDTKRRWEEEAKNGRTKRVSGVNIKE